MTDYAEDATRFKRARDRDGSPDKIESQNDARPARID
jgi:hypothetical protein